MMLSSIRLCDDHRAALLKIVSHTCCRANERRIWSKRRSRNRGRGRGTVLWESRWHLALVCSNHEHEDLISANMCVCVLKISHVIHCVCDMLSLEPHTLAVNPVSRWKDRYKYQRLLYKARSYNGLTRDVKGLTSKWNYPHIIFFFSFFFNLYLLFFLFRPAW